MVLKVSGKQGLYMQKTFFFLNTGNRTCYKAQYFLIAYEIVDFCDI